MWEAYPVYITLKNDNDQTVTVFLRNNAGAVTDDTVNIAYDKITKFEPLETKEVKLSLQTSGKSEVSFTSKLCRELKPGVQHTFGITLSSNPSDRSWRSNVTTKKAVYDEPKSFSSNDLYSKFLTQGLSFKMPKNIPFLDSSNLSLDLGTLFDSKWGNLIRGYGNINGDWFVGIGPTSDFNLGTELTKNWKTKDEKEIRRQTDKMVQETGKKQEEARKKVMKDYKEQHKSTFTGGVDFWCTFSILVGGSFDKKYGDVGFSGFITGAFMGGVKGDFTWSWFFPTPAITLSINVGFKFGLGLALRICMDSKLAFYKDSNIPVFTEGPISAQVNLLVLASLSLSFSAGWKILEVGIGGNATFNATIPIAKASNFKKRVSFSFMTSVFLQFKVLFAKWMVTLASGSIAMENGVKGEWQGMLIGRKKKDGNDAEELEEAYNDYDDEIIALLGESAEPTEIQNGFNPDLSSSTYIKFDGSSTNMVPAVEVSPLVHQGGKDFKYTMKFQFDSDEFLRFYGYDGYSQWVSLDGEPITMQNFCGMSVALANVHWHEQDKDTDIPVYFGALAIQYATSWTTQTVQKPDGSSTQVTTPLRTRTLVMFFWIINGTKVIQKWKYTGPGDDHTSYYRKLNRDALYSEHRNYRMYVWDPSFSHLDKDNDGNPRVRLNGGGLNLFIVDEGGTDDSNITLNTTFCNFVEFDNNGHVVSMKQYPDATRVEYIDVNGGRCAIMTKADGLYYDRTYSISFVPPVMLVSGKIVDFFTYAEGSTTHIIFLKQYTEASTGAVYNKLCGVTIADDWSTKTITEYDVRVNSGNIFGVGDYFGSRSTAAIWIEQEGEGSGQSGKTVKNVKCAYYDPADDVMYTAITLGRLDESTVPAGYEFESFYQFLESGQMTLKYVKKSETPTSVSNQDVLYEHATLPKKISARLIGASSTEPLVTAGMSANFTLTVHNDGNTFLTALNLELYTKDVSGKETVFQEIMLHLTNPKKSVNISYNDMGVEMLAETGEKGARRIGGIFDQTNAENWTVLTTKAKINEQKGTTENRNVHSKALFPDATQTYQVSYNVPKTWQHGTRIIYARVKGIETVANLNELLVGNAENAPAYFITRENGRNVVRYLSANADHASVLRATALYSKAATELGDPDFMNELSACELDLDTISWESGVAELETDYRMFEVGGQEYVSFTITRQGSPNAASDRGVTVRAWTNDPEHYSFSHTFVTPIEPGLVYNITIPVEKLTNGKRVDTFTLKVTDSNDAIRELSDYDNSYTFYLYQGLKLTKQPQSVNICAGGNVTFTAAAEGGTKPYRWRWYYCLPGTEGRWVQIEGAETDTLTRENVPLKMNGTLIRCVVLDANEDWVASENAVLTVVNIPETGDDTNYRLWIALMALCVIAAICIAARRRRT